MSWAHTQAQHSPHPALPLWPDPDTRNSTHDIESVVSDGEFKVGGRSNGPIPSLTNALPNVGVT